MQKIVVPNTDLQASRIAYGCMGIGGDWQPGEPSAEVVRQGRAAIDQALSLGINFFDHANIYCGGKAETVFGEALRNGLDRDTVIIQTKCGIRFGGDPASDAPHRYDFTYEHIIESVDRSLSRLKTDFIDILLLHRPDPLMEPEVIARAFEELSSRGKVRYFGVSNFTPIQIELLQRDLSHKLVTNQIQASPLHVQPFDSGIVAGYSEPGTALRGDDTVDYCRLHNILVQAYSPLAGGRLCREPGEDAEPRIRTTIDVLNQLAQKYGVSSEAVAVAFLLRHPAGIQPIVGTSKADRLPSIMKSLDIQLSHSDWHRILQAGRGRRLP